METTRICEQINQLTGEHVFLLIVSSKGFDIRTFILDKDTYDLCIKSIVKKAKTWPEGYESPPLMFDGNE